MRNSRRPRRGIRRKVTLFIILASSSVLAAGMLSGYALGYYLVKGIISRDTTTMARLISDGITNTMDENIEQVSSYASSGEWKDACAKSNQKYEEMEKGAKLDYFYNMDKKWTPAGSDSSPVKEYVRNGIADGLRRLQKEDKDIAEAFITDKYGCLVAASGKTSDFYQADEKWWQSAYDKGRGRVFVGDAEFDESSGFWVVPVAVPIRDATGAVTGVCKTAFATNSLFSSLGRFRLGETGRALITDGSGYVVFHRDIAPMSVKYCGDEQFKKLFMGEEGFGVVVQPAANKSRLFSAFANVSSPVLLKNGIRWKVFVERDAGKALAPLKRLIFGLAVIMGVIILLIIPIGNCFSEMLTGSIKELRDAVSHMAKDDPDYTVEVRTGDEIEELADAFRDMATSVRTKQTLLTESRDRLEKLSGGLAREVEARTKELVRTQEATMNILEDLTEAKARLKEALKIKSEFTSTISHELRTPLTAFKEGIAIVLDGTAGPLNDEQKEFLDIASRNVDRLTRLISNILDFQKLESGKMVFNMKENDINEVAKEVCDTMGPLALKNGLDLAAKLGEDIPKATFDRDRIMQVFTNIVNNAIKFTERGVITVKTAVRENAIEVCVEDTGPGIRKEDMPRLFQQFMQIDAGSEGRAGGTGLGLAISKDIIEGHGGRIWVESEFGKGAAFYFVLPAHERRRG